ncbi:MAG: threonine--tRNA ligase, partial [Candidatus Omnitrophica bacterium]|nr:threonine--tRNA ligase [Candidatus Omnitrophota bacterium]
MSRVQIPSAPLSNLLELGIVMDKEYMERYWHTSSHILAQAVKKLFPDVRLGTGPAIEDGFYYDFYRKEPFTPADIEKISRVMEDIIREDLPVEKISVIKEDAKKILKDEPFKLEILEGIKEATVTFYRQG